MRAFVVFSFILISNLFADCYDEICKDSLSATTATNNFTQTTNEEFKAINQQILKAQEKQTILNNLTAKKLQTYIAHEYLKQEELITLKSINFLIKKLIEQENAKIRALQIRTKVKLND